MKRQLHILFTSLTGGAVLGAAALLAQQTAAHRRRRSPIPSLARGGRRREGHGVGEREERRDAGRVDEVAPLHAGLRAGQEDHGSKDRIAFPQIGDRIYNFWQDDVHERGIWRRTSLQGLFDGKPAWETVIDVDALAKEEKAPGRSARLIAWSPRIAAASSRCPARGSDAVESREFDLTTKQWIKDGFRLREAKTSTAWIDENAMLVGTDFGSGSMTTSGYARSVRLWNCGTPIESARMVLEIPATDMGLFAFSYDAGGRKYVRISHQKDFYSSTQ